MKVLHSLVSSFLFLSLSTFLTSVVADNCKGSINCHWNVDLGLFAKIVDVIPDNATYYENQRIACIGIAQCSQIFFFNWALPMGYCLHTKHTSLTGSAIKTLYSHLRDKCGRCGSVDVKGSKGGELTFNYVADIRKGCPGRDVNTGLYESGLCLHEQVKGVVEEAKGKGKGGKTGREFVG